MLRGYSRGLLATAATYIAPVLGLMLAADFSSPMRDRLSQATAWPDIVLDILAPVVVFILVVVAVRLVAAVFARMLGVGLSAPSRVLAAAAGAIVSSLVLGALVVLVHQMRPNRVPVTTDNKDKAGQALASPIEKAILDVDRWFSESLLAPPLAEFASAVINEAMARNDSPFLKKREEVEEAARNAADAAAAVGKLPLGAVAPQRGGGEGR